jgi:trk system potassium uptake protein
LARDSKYLPLIAFILVYIVLITLGFTVLLLPGAATRPLNNTETLFTTISAVTLTGLQACDFPGIFTQQGEIIILLLIQSGAITIISFALFFGWLLGQGHIFTNDKTLLDSGAGKFPVYLKILKKTCIYLFSFELISIGILYAFWTGDITYTPSQKLHYAIFNGISVFCQSGFSNLEGNFSNPHLAHSYILMLALTGVIILGSIGYAAMIDLILIKRLRERMADPDKNWTLQTRVTLYATAIFIGLGSILFYFIEKDHALGSQKLVEAAISSIFNAAGAKSAGFYSIPLDHLNSGIIKLYMVLMLIGASATSATGGIRNSVVYLQFFGKSYQQRKARNYLALYCIIVLVMSVLFIASTDSLFSHRSLQFEALSAFTNCGLSFGITSTLSIAGKYILMADMVLGRVGIPVVVYLVLINKTENTGDVLMI